MRQNGVVGTALRGQVETDIFSQPNLRSSVRVCKDFDRQAHSNTPKNASGENHKRLSDAGGSITAGEYYADRRLRNHDQIDAGLSRSTFAVTYTLARYSFVRIASGVACPNSERGIVLIIPAHSPARHNTAVISRTDSNAIGTGLLHHSSGNTRHP